MSDLNERPGCGKETDDYNKSSIIQQNDLVNILTKSTEKSILFFEENTLQFRGQISHYMKENFQ